MAGGRVADADSLPRAVKDLLVKGNPARMGPADHGGQQTYAIIRFRVYFPSAGGGRAGQGGRSHCGGVQAGYLAITADLPLDDRVVSMRAVALNPRRQAL